MSGTSSAYVHYYEDNATGRVLKPVIIFDDMTTWTGGGDILIGGDGNTIRLNDPENGPGFGQNSGPANRQEGSKFAVGFHPVGTSDGTNVWDSGTWLVYHFNGNTAYYQYSGVFNPVAEYIKSA